ncbi:UMP kinase [Candidatus Microgenomates bacterium]|nr:UMP kinase [Candidatus Microgenomates bacterium]
MSIFGNANQERPIVLSIGGSLLVPGGVDTEFLSKLNTFIRKHVREGKRFFLVIGGGRLARTYRDAGKEVVGSMTMDDLDWLGIHATRLNAHLVRTIFQDIAHPRIIENYDHKLSDAKESVVIGAGWKPGWSTDYCAVVLAHEYGGKLLVNMSNVDWIYDCDPKKFKDAKILKEITWAKLPAIVGTTWTPGLNAPFDPIAGQLAAKHELTVIVANGSNFANLEKIVTGQDGFDGTVIHP